MKLYHAFKYLGSKTSVFYVSIDENKLRKTKVGYIFDWEGHIGKLFNYIFESNDKVKVIR